MSEKLVVIATVWTLVWLSKRSSHSQTHGNPADGLITHSQSKGGNWWGIQPCSGLHWASSQQPGSGLNIIMMWGWCQPGCQSLVCPRPSGYLLKWAQAGVLGGKSCFHTLRAWSLSSYWDVERWAGSRSSISRWAPSAEVKKAVGGRWEALRMPRPPDHTGRVAWS